MIFRRYGGCIAFFLVLLGCSSSPTRLSISPEEQAKKDNTYGLELAKGFETGLVFKHDRPVLDYLHRLTVRLSKGTPLDRSQFQIKVIKDKKQQWHHFGLPGVQLYLSSGFLREVRYENELAAAIAFELAHVLNRHLVNRIEEEIEDVEDRRLVVVRPFGKGSQFLKFKPIDLEQSVETAVELLYQAGYDSRGMISLWKLYEERSQASPYDTAQLGVLINKTYRTIVSYTPLRNPIVRSDEFLTIQKRIRRL